MVEHSRALQLLRGRGAETHYALGKVEQDASPAMILAIKIWWNVVSNLITAHTLGSISNVSGETLAIRKKGPRMTGGGSSSGTARLSPQTVVWPVSVAGWHPARRSVTGACSGQKNRRASQRFVDLLVQRLRRKFCTAAVRRFL